MRTLVVPALLLALAFLVTRLPAPSVPAGSPVEASTAAAPPAAAPNSHYPSNRPPLAPNPLVKLSIGAVEPRGWLMAQLQLMRNGLTGRLGEVSRFLGDDSGWITLKGKGWEELPYWLKGYGDLGYLLKDAVLRKETERWLAHAFRSQSRDGSFGPADNLAARDLWPNMVMLAALQSYYEATGDRRVPEPALSLEPGASRREPSGQAPHRGGRAARLAHGPAAAHEGRLYGPLERAQPLPR